MGTPFECDIAEYMRTTIYEIPGPFIEGDSPPPLCVVDDSGFTAWVTTDPAGLLKGHAPSDHWNVDPGLPKALQGWLERPGNSPRQRVFVVIQIKEDLESFPATHGQCIKTEDDGIEKLFIVECVDANNPQPDERTRRINSLLTAIRAGFGTTTGLQRSFDSRCFRTTDGRCLYPLSLEGTATLQVARPFSGDDVRTKVDSCRALFEKIEAGIGGQSAAGRAPLRQDFGPRLEDLTEALQLDPSIDDAYQRLWYLRLWDRLNEFGKTTRLQIENNRDLKEEKDHRNLIAHRGVDRIDGKLLSSLQTKAFGIIKAKL